jgi:hypothetical protein
LFKFIVFSFLAVGFLSCGSSIQVDLFDQNLSPLNVDPPVVTEINPLTDSFSVTLADFSLSVGDLPGVSSSSYTVLEDFNGDGFLDSVISPGSGLLTTNIENTLVISGKDNSILYNFTPSNHILEGAEHLVVNDLNNDGVMDIITIHTFTELNAYSGIDGTLLWQTPITSIQAPILKELEDVNSDGKNDFLLENIFAGRDYYTVYSGIDGTVLWEQDYALFGKVLDINVPDKDVDGLKDILIWDWGIGARVISSATGLVIQSCASVAADQMTIGDDYNNDGTNDYIEFEWDESIRPVVISGLDCSVLYTVVATGLGSVYSKSLLEDVNSDTVEDFLINESTFDTNRGKISIISGNDGAILHSLAGPAQNCDFKFEDTISDINSDGIKDLYTTHVTATLRNVITVYSGADLSEIYQISSDTLIGESFDVKVFDTDLNGDGVIDLIMSNLEYDSDRGRVYIFSGSDGSLIKSFDGENQGDELSGVSLTDIDGNGKLELNLSAAGFNSNLGKIYVYELNESF